MSTNETHYVPIVYPAVLQINNQANNKQYRTYDNNSIEMSTPGTDESQWLGTGL